MSTETNGFTFTFPRVTNAYKTSIHRKLSSNVLKTILGESLLIAVGTGVGVYLSHILIEYTQGWDWVEGRFFLGILLIVLFPTVTALGGFFVGNAVGKSAIKSKFPDALTVGKLGLAIGLVGYLAYLTMYVLFYYAPERFDHWIDYLRQAFYLVVFVGVAWIQSTSKVENTPFCENCNNFMLSDDIGEYNTQGSGKGLDITQESAIVKILDSRQFFKLNELNTNWVIGSYCVIRIWHCTICNDNGFIDFTTVQSVTNRQGKVKSAHRLIHSSHIAGEEIQTLMQTRKIFGAQKGKS